MATYKVTFDRIGRNHSIPEQVIEAVDGDALAETLYRFAGKHLGSREWDVLLLEDGEISVGGGRSGKGRWEEVS